MNTVLKGAFAAALLAGSTVAATAPAQADRGGGAVFAGIAGLAIGAAIASDHHRGYYAEPTYYAPAPTYYAPAPAYYGGGYSYGYAPSYGYEYRGGYRDHYRGRDGWNDRGGRRDDRGGWDHDRR